MDDARSKKRDQHLKIQLSLWLLLVLGGCAGTQLPLVGEHSFSVLEDEARLFNRSKEAVAVLERSGMIYREPALDAYLNGLYADILPGDLKADHLNFEIRVIDQPETNAFILPTGQMYISTSMLALMDNEDQLVCLMGHELTHVLHRHGLKMKRSTANKAAFFQSVSIIGPLAAFAEVSSISGYSRSLESEADQGGFDVMRAHGYDVTQAERLYAKLLQFNKDEDIKEPFFFSTHPMLEKRKKNAGLLKEIDPRTVQQSVDEKVFKERLKNVRIYALERWLQNGMFHSVERYAGSLIRDFPEEANGYYLKGELFRMRQDPADGEKKRMKDEDYQKAIEAYNQALLKNHRFASAYRSRGILYKKLGEDQKGREDLQQYLMLNPQAHDYAFIQSLAQKEQE